MTMESQIVDVLGDEPVAGEIQISEDDPARVILIIHAGHDQIRLHGLDPNHARLVQLALNAPYAEE